MIVKCCVVNNGSDKRQVICVHANVRSSSNDDSSVPVQLDKGSPYKLEQIVLLPECVDDVRWVCAGPSADQACANRQDAPTAGLRNFVVERVEWNARLTTEGDTERHSVSTHTPHFRRSDSLLASSRSQSILSSTSARSCTTTWTCLLTLTA